MEGFLPLGWRQGGIGRYGLRTVVVGVVRRQRIGIEIVVPTRTHQGGLSVGYRGEIIETHRTEVDYPQPVAAFDVLAVNDTLVVADCPAVAPVGGDLIG